MAADHSREAGDDPAEALIDDLIRDILNEAGQSPRTAARGRAPAAALIETAVISSPGGVSRMKTLDRLLLAEAVASALAEALAPALAEALAPRIMNILEHPPGEPGQKEPAQAVSGDRARKSETK
jgi:hypothetical protein